MKNDTGQNGNKIGLVRKIGQDGKEHRPRAKKLNDTKSNIGLVQKMCRLTADRHKKRQVAIIDELT
jgi:hypothetical protein